MKILKTSILIIFLLIGNHMYGQSGLYSITVHAGGELSDMDVEKIKSDPKFGFRTGAGFEFNLPRNFFLQTGLDFATKGAKAKWKMTGDINGDRISNDYVSGTEKMNMMYLVLPIRGGYRLDVSSVIRMNLSLGPYFGYGVGGKSTYKQAFISGIDPENEGLLTELPLTYYDYRKYNTFSSDACKKFDMGLSGNVGIEYNRLLLNIGYEYGFIDYSRGQPSAYNNSLYLTVGYRIL